MRHNPKRIRVLFVGGAFVLYAVILLLLSLYRASLYPLALWLLLLIAGTAVLIDRAIMRFAMRYQTLVEELQRDQAEMENLAMMRKEFSANVSHELKTPLTSISGYAEIMMNNMVMPRDIPTFSERILNESRRLLHLIDDIIKLSRLDEKGLELDKVDMDLYQCLHSIIHRLSLTATQKKVRIHLTGEPVLLHCIPHLIDEMAYNLCENAIKYNKEGGAVNVWVGKCLQGVKMIVQDTGIGIPKEDEERVFERFYRVDKSHSKATGGTGLGLSIVKNVAILHHATIAVDSEVGRGTKIEVVFPR